MRLAKPKPCPFCKSTDIYMERQSFDCSVDICNNCGARGPSHIAAWDDTDADERMVRGLWNSRSESAYKSAYDKSQSIDIQ